MNWWQKLPLPLRALWQKEKLDARMDDEMRSHLEMQTQENIAAGMNPEEARYAALRQFGRVESIKETCREPRGVSWIENLGQDIRYGLRMLRRNPGFTAVAVLTLAICLGANLAIFAVMDAILVRSLPLPHADRLVVIHNAYPASGVERGQATISDYFERRGSIDALESLSMFQEGTCIVGERDGARWIQGASVTPEFFQTLGITLAKGATFTDAEMNYGGRDQVAIITDQFWRDHFGADSNVIGRVFKVNGLPIRVIGVLPAGFRYLSSKAQTYHPLSHPRETRDLARYTARAREHDGQMVARLRPGRTLAQAQAQLAVVNSRRLAKGPLSGTLKAAGYRPWVEPLRTAHVSSVKSMVLLVQVGAMFLLLLGGINLAGLLLIRASGRAKEMAVRQALGAGRGRLAREILTETTVLSLAGGVGGVLLAVASLRLAVALGIDALPLGADIVFDSRIGLAAILASVVIGLGIGLPILWLHLRGR